LTSEAISGELRALAAAHFLTKAHSPMRLRIARVLGLTGWIAIAAMSGGPSLSQPAAVSSRTEFGYGIFERSCLNCHGNPKFERAPSPAALREMTPEHI
jgi:hypothetical protein